MMQDSGADVWCIFGRPHGEYIIACTTDPHALSAIHHRAPGDGTRMIRLIAPGASHQHAPGACLPTHVLYRAHRAYRVDEAISRSLVAGEKVIVL